MDAFGILATACGTGFLFLLGWVMKLQGEMGEKPNHKWCEDHFAAKDVIDVKLDKIEDDVKDIKESVKTLVERG